MFLIQLKKIHLIKKTLSFREIIIKVQLIISLTHSLDVNSI